MLAYVWAESDKAGWAYTKKAFGMEDKLEPIKEWRKGLVEKAVDAYKRAREEQGEKPQWSVAMGHNVLMLD